MPSQWMIPSGNGSLESSATSCMRPWLCRRVCGLVLLILRVATDGCLTQLCDASYHVFPAMKCHVDRSWRGSCCSAWWSWFLLVARRHRRRMAFVGLLALGLVYVAADAVLLDVGFCVSKSQFGRRGSVQVR